MQHHSKSIVVINAYKCLLLFKIKKHLQHFAYFPVMAQTLRIHSTVVKYMHNFIVLNKRSFLTFVKKHFS